MEALIAEKVESIGDAVVAQKLFFNGGRLRDVDFRKQLLRQLKTVLQSNEALLYEAIYKDFGKSEFETYSTELSFIYNEIDFFLKNLNRLCKPKSVATNLANQIGRSYIHQEAYGNVLVFGAWNYPYQLSILPAIAAIAAGNTVLLKPSELPWNTAMVMENLINSNFPKEIFHIINGGVEIATALLKFRFDKIFFTGSTAVGKIVYKAAANHLTPVTLELGGKSPVIVTSAANIKVAAKRIVWGKFLNAGQTCIAPDYLLVDRKIKSDLIGQMGLEIKQFNYNVASQNYTKIINQRNFDRLIAMVDKEKIVFGGEFDRASLFIAPTILDNITWQDSIMQEEIFGPLLPILDFSYFEEVFQILQEKEKPLSAYLFSANSSEKKAFVDRLSFGGGCINDTVMHIVNANLPFGGVGYSGMGSYHGKYGFETFSHQKSVMEKTVRFEPDFKYPPYTETKKKWVKRLL